MADSNKPQNATHQGHAIEKIDDIFSHLTHGALLVFLDYDGTLSPIRPRPEMATLSESMREAVTQLSQVAAVAVVSGRGLADVKNMVAIDGIYYGGSHGFEIEGPGIQQELPEAQKSLPYLQDAYQELADEVKPLDGVWVEKKKFALAVHFREASDEDGQKACEKAQQIASRHKELRLTTGKMIRELRPNISWDKGKAILFLKERLEHKYKEPFIIYVGDDDTDEDAFKALKATGLGIGVRVEKTENSDAKYYLNDCDEVEEFLRNLCQWESSQ